MSAFRSAASAPSGKGVVMCPLHETWALCFSAQQDVFSLRRQGM